MEAFLRELVAHYESHSIAPGLQTAYLQDQDKFYCAVHTFPLDTIASRKVVAKATESTYDGAVAKCKEVWDKIMLQEKMDRLGVN
jgi:hypothetical protein